MTGKLSRKVNFGHCVGIVSDRFSLLTWFEKGSIVIGSGRLIGGSTEQRKEEKMKKALLVLVTTLCPSFAFSAERCFETEEGLVCVEYGSLPDESRKERPQCKDLRGTKICLV